MEKTNKELVIAGHELAKTLSADTPLIEIAKFVSDLATRLDVQTVLAQQLAAQNAAAMDIVGRLIGQYSCAGYHAVQNSNNPAQSLLYDAMQVEKVTATTEWVNRTRAEGVEMVSVVRSEAADIARKNGNSEIANALEFQSAKDRMFAEQLRGGDKTACSFANDLSQPNISDWLNETNANAVAAHAAFLWRRANEIVAEGGDKALVISVRIAAKLADEHAAQLRGGEVKTNG